MALTANDLSNAMVAALPVAWKQVTGEDFPLPSVADESKVLFLTIAMGLLQFLKAHSNDAVSTITLTAPVGGDVTYPVTSIVINTP